MRRLNGACGTCVSPSPLPQALREPWAADDGRMAWPCASAHPHSRRHCESSARLDGQLHEQRQPIPTPAGTASERTKLVYEWPDAASAHPHSRRHCEAVARSTIASCQQRQPIPTPAGTARRATPSSSTVPPLLASAHPHSRRHCEDGRPRVINEALPTASAHPHSRRHCETLWRAALDTGLTASAHPHSRRHCETPRTPPRTPD